jgi:hypothetical protein
VVEDLMGEEGSVGHVKTLAITLRKDLSRGGI